MKRICFSCVVTLCTMLFVMSSSCSKDNSLKLPEEKVESNELVQKELIYSSLSVAAYSFKYWETTLP